MCVFRVTRRSRAAARALKQLAFEIMPTQQAHQCYTQKSLGRARSDSPSSLKMLRAKQSSLTNAASKFCVAARLWLSVTSAIFAVVLSVTRFKMV